MPEKEKGQGNVSSTAWTIAHRRTLTDISFSQEIFFQIEKMRKEEGLPDVSEEFITPELAPQIEARYKLINRQLYENNADQILELAAGFGPRGLDMVDFEKITYVELDFPEVASKKRRIVNAIVGTSCASRNLHIVDGNALDLKSLQTTAKTYFDRSKPIAVVHEGLLRYLNFDEKAVVGSNIHNLLEEFGGIWVTCDISLKNILKIESSMTDNKIEKVKKSIGVDIHKNLFENVDHAQSFLENLGFSVEKHNFMEVIDELTSPKILNQTKEQVGNLIGGSYVFAMRIANKT